MTTVSQNSLQTGDWVQQPICGYYDVWGTYIPYSVPYWNPPVYIQPSYVPGTIVINNDWELKEEVKGLKEEIKKLRKELAKK